MVTGRLALIFLLLHQAIAGNPVFLQPLSDIIAAETEETIVLTCKVRANNLFWVVNETWYFESTMLSLQQNGFSFPPLSYEADGSISGSVTVDVSKNNLNNTILWCHASNNESDTVSSNATIYIAGVPLPPNPIFIVLDEITVQVKWAAPFTWSAFPILNYTVQVINLTSAVMLASQVVPIDTLSYNVTSTTPPSCIKLEFIVSATNKIGAANGKINGSFPSAPGEFGQTVTTTFLLTSQDNVHLNISFIVPFLCEYSDGTYSIVINTRERDITIGPHFVSWKMSGKLLSTLISQGLEVNTVYTATVKVETLVGLSHSTFRFNTCIATESCSSTDHEIIVISGTVGGVMGAAVSCSIVILYVTLRYRRCQKTNGGQPTDFVHSPNTNGSSIYEEITGNAPFKTRHVERAEGYVSIAASGRITKDNLPSEQQTVCEMVTVSITTHSIMKLTVSIKGVPVNEDTYTVMNSAGTVTFQLRGSDSEPAVSIIL